MEAHAIGRPGLDCDPPRALSFFEPASYLPTPSDQSWAHPPHHEYMRSSKPMPLAVLDLAVIPLSLHLSLRQPASYLPTPPPILSLPTAS
jgi:hypothetical protein